MKSKNVKRIISFFISITLLIIMTFPVQAKSASDITDTFDLINGGEITLNNGETIQIKINSVGEYEFVRNTRKLVKSKTDNYGKIVEKEFLLTSEKAIVDSPDMANKIVKGILNSQNVTGDGWFLGSSLYMEVKMNYVTKSTNFGTGYLVNYVKATSTVYNGTVIDSKYLNTSAISTSEYGTAFFQQQHYDIKYASNPYYDYNMSIYPYLISGYELSANLIIDAHRPNGSSYNYIVEAVIFRN